jgi:cytochrome b561
MNNVAAKLTGMRLYSIMFGMLIAGTANTILTKWQNSLVGVKLPPPFGPGEYAKFTHPYVQSANMFIGEMLCLVFYGAKLFYNKRR